MQQRGLLDSSDCGWLTAIRKLDDMVPSSILLEATGKFKRNWCSELHSLLPFAFRLCSRLTALWRYINCVLLLLLLLLFVAFVLHLELQIVFLSTSTFQPQKFHFSTARINLFRTVNCTLCVRRSGARFPKNQDDHKVVATSSQISS